MAKNKPLIIGIHGLGNKPPQKLLKKWWEMSISEGLLNHYGILPYFDFELVYWADYIYSEPMNLKTNDKTSPLYITEPYQKANGQQYNKNLKERFLGYFRSKLGRIILSNNFYQTLPLVTETIIKKYFREIDIYYSSETKYKVKFAAKEVIRSILAENMQKYRDRKILLIGHSMGSLIAYDVLSEIDFEIDTFISAGSPIGIPYLLEKIKKEKGSDAADTLPVPNSIKNHWYNFTDPQDKISCYFKLADFFKNNISGVIPEDKFVSNNYICGEEHNPHKIYGYLRSKEVSEIIYTMIIENKSKSRLWFESTVSKILFKKDLWIK